MIFEDILHDVGGFGLYQKFLLCTFLVPCSFVISWFFMSTIFTVSTPDHWCYVPEVAGSNLSQELQRRLISPAQDLHCSMYDVNYSSILESGNFTLQPDWPTKSCDKGWQYDKSNYDATAVTRWSMVCQNDFYSSLPMTLLFVGVTVGTPFLGLMSDKVGRKPTLLLTAFIICLSDIGSTLSPYFELYLVLKAFSGACLTSIFSNVFIMLLEIVSPDRRARVNGISTVAFTLGMCVLPLVAYGTRSWVYLSMTTSAAAASILVLYWRTVPESPRWLISQGRCKEAHEILGTIRKYNSNAENAPDNLMQKIEKLGQELKCEKSIEEKASPLDFFRYPKLRKRFLLATICWLASFMPYYGHHVNVRNLGGNEFLNFFYLSAVEVPGVLFGWVAMETLGRRWCNVIAFSVASIASFLPVIYPPEYKMVVLIAALLAKAGSSAAFMTVYIHAPELFPTSLRAVGMGLCATTGSASTLIAPYIVYLAKFGSYIPFLCFGVIALMGVLAAFFLPETLDQELPQTVEDVESSESKQSFFSCGRASVDEPVGAFDPKEDCEDIKCDLSPIPPRRISKNSFDSMVGVYTIPSNLRNALA